MFSLPISSIACLAIVVTASLLVCIAHEVQAQERSDARPNILVILVDDLGYGDLSSYGATDLQTPHIDQLIARGMRFDRFYANCPVCSPTRAAVLTGCYPDRVGVPGVIRTHPENSWGYFQPVAETLPRRLRDSGYRTAIVGKWHLGLDEPKRPEAHGFDRFQGFLGDMMDDYYTHRRHGVNYMRDGDREIEPTGHATDLFSDWASELIEQQNVADRPLFLYLAYNAPHTPIQPPDGWTEKVLARESGISANRAKIVALIEHLDAGIGRVLKSLEQSGQADNTVVVFTSDNGGDLDAGASCGDLRAGKGTMYEGGLRVPAAVVWPGKIAADSQSSMPLATIDLLPTLVEAAGGRVTDTDRIDGVSFLPTLLGKRQAPVHEELYFVRREGGNFGGKTIEALQQGDWKLVWNDPFGPPELFNLANDPLEHNDVIAKEKAIAKRLSDRMRLHIQAGGERSWQQPNVAPARR